MKIFHIFDSQITFFLLLLLSNFVFADDTDFPLRASSTNPECLETQNDKLVHIYAPHIYGRVETYDSENPLGWKVPEQGLLELFEPLTVSSSSVEQIDEFTTLFTIELFQDAIDSEFPLSFFVTVFPRGDDFHVHYGDELMPWGLYTFKGDDDDLPLKSGIYVCAPRPMNIFILPQRPFLDFECHPETGLCVGTPPTLQPAPGGP